MLPVFLINIIIVLILISLYVCLYYMFCNNHRIEKKNTKKNKKTLIHFIVPAGKDQIFD